MLNKYNMNEVKFLNDEERLSKLKELDVIPKTKNLDYLSELVYKKVDLDGIIQSYNCKIIGYNWKDNNEKCLNKKYENLRIQVEDEIFDINIEYLKDMQKKSWGTI